MESADVGTSSPNRECCAGASPYSCVGAPVDTYLGGTGGDAIREAKQSNLGPRRNDFLKYLLATGELIKRKRWAKVVIKD
jgi:hypothetical protein